MICQSCRKRKAKHVVYDNDLSMALNICTRCKEWLYDEANDNEAIEREAERQAELNAGEYHGRPI